MRPGTRAATSILRALVARGVRAVFGIPGGSIGPIFDALVDVPELDLVTTRHEATAVFAALGHARMTGTPAVVLVTSGPGVTNTITGVATAHLEELPLIVIGGEVATTWSGRAAFQDGSQAGLDLVALMRNITRWSATINSPSMVQGAMERAWSYAMGPRPGPVFLSVPYDVAQTPFVDRPIISPLPQLPLAPNPTACRAAAELLDSARKPLLLLGTGARGATNEAVRLAERLAMPVAVTAHAKGAFPERHPLYLGLLGNSGHPSVRDYALDLDVVCVVGSRLGDFATNGWQVPIRGRVGTIQIDRDPLLIGRNAPVTLGIVADARMALAEIALATAGTNEPERRVAFRRKPWAVDTAPGLVKPQAAVTALGEAFPDAVFCSDIGEHMAFAQHYLTVERADRFHCMSGLGAMGSGIGAAIGVKHARPHETVVAFVGDGGFNMHVGDLLTCAEQRIGVIFAVFNDGRWNMVEHGFRAVFRRVPDTLPRQVADLAAVARGYGVDAIVIDSPQALLPDRLRSYVREGVPLVLDIRIDPAESLTADTRSLALSRIGQSR